MKNKKIIFMLLLSLACVSCKNKNGQTVQESAGVVQMEDTSQVQKAVAEQTSDQPLPEESSVWYEGEKPFVFDYFEDYPITDIRLSELADVSYLPLETNDSVLVRLIGTCYGNEYFLTKESIYMQDGQILYVFDRNGNYIRHIERRGGGPEEFRLMTSYAVDEERKEIFVQDGYAKKGGRTMVYSLEGDFLRDFQARADEIALLNDSLMVGYYRYFGVNSPYSVMRKSDGSVVCYLPIKPVDAKYVSTEFMAYGSLTTTPRGILLGSLANDTIFELRKDLTLTPRIIDKSHYGTHYAQAHPTIETSRYLMFYTLVGQNYGAKIKNRFYIYDKKECRIYQMKEHKDNSYWRLLDDYPHVTNWDKTQNSQVAVYARQVYALMEGKGKHGPAELQELLETLDEEDNPVLEIMMFHSVDEIK